MGRERRSGEAGPGVMLGLTRHHADSAFSRSVMGLFSRSVTRSDLCCGRSPWLLGAGEIEAGRCGGRETLWRSKVLSVCNSETWGWGSGL